MEYRIKFTKGDTTKYIGHLDVLNLFQRAIKRANLPVKYSQGFNPHQEMSFTSPLSLGHTSCGEYLDISFTEDLDISYIIESLNKALPDDTQVLGGIPLTKEDKSGMSILMAALYEITLCDNIDDNIFTGLINQDEILELKKTKRGENTVNIKPDIIWATKEGNKITACLCAGSKRNLKPELLANAIYKKAELPLDMDKILIKRMEMYKVADGKLVTLLNEGTDIAYEENNN